MIESEYGIKTDPDSTRNPQSNAIIEIIHQVLRNLVCTYNLQETYVDDTDLWIGILAAADFSLSSMYHRGEVKVLVQLVFYQDVIFSINHVAY